MASGAPVAGVYLRLLGSHLLFLLRIKAPGLSLPQGQACAVSSACDSLSSVQLSTN